MREKQLSAGRTGWWYTDAQQEVGCSRCGVVAGEPCRTPKGRRTNVPHGERMRAFTKKLKENDDMGMYRLAIDEVKVR